MAIFIADLCNEKINVTLKDGVCRKYPRKV